MTKLEVTPVRHLTPREVANMLGISYDVLRRMILSNHIKAIRMPPGKLYWIPAGEVLRYVDEHGIPLLPSNRKLLEELNQEASSIEASA